MYDLCVGILSYTGMGPKRAAHLKSPKATASDLRSTLMATMVLFQRPRCTDPNSPSPTLLSSSSSTGSISYSGCSCSLSYTRTYLQSRTAEVRVGQANKQGGKSCGVQAESNVLWGCFGEAKGGVNDNKGDRGCTLKAVRTGSLSAARPGTFSLPGPPAVSPPPHDRLALHPEQRQRKEFYSFADRWRPLNAALARSQDAVC